MKAFFAGATLMLVLAGLSMALFTVAEQPSAEESVYVRLDETR
ncbi:MAG TPA: hypothetical protein VIN77_13265 [Aurantimonas sp.]|nr:hypothetical protein [Aurantimonas marianensis]